MTITTAIVIVMGLKSWLKHADYTISFQEVQLENIVFFRNLNERFYVFIIINTVVITLIMIDYKNYKY